jgi:hypothetical protein
MTVTIGMTVTNGMTETTGMTGANAAPISRNSVAFYAKRRRLHQYLDFADFFLFAGLSIGLFRDGLAHHKMFPAPRQLYYRTCQLDFAQKRGNGNIICKREHRKKNVITTFPTSLNYRCTLPLTII